MTARRVPFFSCVIPAYNRAPYLAQAIESALMQDVPASEREIIVVDDGSTDATSEVLRRYAGRIRIFRQRRQGQGAAYRRAVAFARGEIVAGLDSDDVWLPSKLSRVAQAFEKRGDVVAVAHGVKFVDARLRPLKFQPAWRVPEDRILDLNRDSILQYSPAGQVLYGSVLFTTGSAWAVKRAAVVGKNRSLRLRFPAEPIWPEQWIMLAAAAAGGSAVRLGDALSLYRRHENNESRYPAHTVEDKILLRKYSERLASRALQFLDCAPRRALAHDLRTMARRYAAEILLLEARR